MQVEFLPKEGTLLWLKDLDHVGHLRDHVGRLFTHERVLTQVKGF